MQRSSRVIAKLKIADDPSAAEARAVAAWKIAAGNKVVSHTRAISLVRSTLVVEVEDMLWQRNLGKLQPFLLHNLETILGQPLVKDIDFRPMPKRRPVQIAASSHGTDGIGDPVLNLLYQAAKKKGSA